MNLLTSFTIVSGRLQISQGHSGLPRTFSMPTCINTNLVNLDLSFERFDEGRATHGLGLDNVVI